MIKSKNKKKRINKNSRNNYKLWSNGRLFSLILLGISILMFILSIVDLPFFSIFPGYTFGFLFGYYSYIFYCFLAFYSISKLFNIQIYLIKFISKVKVFHYSWLNTFILAFGIIILLESSFYLSNNNNVFPGLNSWDINFNNWWSEFTNNHDALKPDINNSGVVINIVISLFYSIGGVIVSLIISFLLIFYFVFYLFFSSPIKKFGNDKKRKKVKEAERIEYETKIMDLSFEDNNKIVVSGFKTEIINFDKNEDGDVIDYKLNAFDPLPTQVTEEVIKDETVPFDNPFDDNSTSFIAPDKKTKETFIKKRNKKKNNTTSVTEFIFDNSASQDVKKPNTYKRTKEFSFSDDKEEEIKITKNNKRKK